MTVAQDATQREQLAMTQRLIDRDPTILTLRRPESGRSAAGGPTRGGSNDQTPITVMFGAKTRDGLPLQDTQGERVVQYYTILAMPGTDIKNDDMFTLNGQDYKVTFVHTNLSYEVKADVEAVAGGYH